MLFDKIRSELDFAEFVGKSTKLTHQGGGRYRGLSPFTNESTPSFFVDNNAKTWFDFSSHQGGGILDFVCLVKNFDKREAISFLAGYLGIEEEEPDTLSKLLSDSQQYFVKHKQKAIDYMTSRGFSSSVVDKYGIGYCPSSFLGYLRHSGYSDGTIIESGMGITRGFSKNLLGMKYHDRVTIPIRDAYGKLVSFTGRLVDSGSPKYIHGNTTRLFKKSELVWNLSNVRGEIHKQDLVIVCEGQMDAIAISEAGFPGVAILGSSMSEEQLKVLSKLTRNIYIVFDSDAAGESGLLKLFQMISDGKLDSIIYSISLPDGQDPEEFLKAHGKPEFQEIIYSAIPDTAVIVQSLIRKYANDNKSRAAVSKSVIDGARQYLTQNYTYRSLDLMERLAQELGLDSQKLASELARFQKSWKFSNKSDEDIQELTIFNDVPIYEKRLFYEILNNPKLLARLEHEHLNLTEFESSFIYRALSLLNVNMDSLEALDVLKENLPEEDYFSILAFLSLGFANNDFNAALNVFKNKVISRTRKPKIDFLGRQMRDQNANRIVKTVLGVGKK